MTHWNMDPEICRIGPFVIRWYGLFFTLSFIFGFFLFNWIYRKEKKSPIDIHQLMVYMLIGTMAGARIGHCLFYDLFYFLSHPLDIFKIWEGGLASHGAAIGIFLALSLYSRKHGDQPFVWLLDRMAIPVALAGALIRTGNLFNSEIIGVPTQKPWALVFERVDQMPRHPAQVYEASVCLILFVFLVIIYIRRNAQAPPGMLLGLFLSMVFGFRFFVEFLKEDQAAFERMLPLNMGQMLSIPAVMTGLFLFFRAFHKSPDLSGR
jgi:phosphatidylglycerol---prolipoprotein diacylglyceryl transferase